LMSKLMSLMTAPPFLIPVSGQRDAYRALPDVSI